MSNKHIIPVPQNCNSAIENKIINQHKPEYCPCIPEELGSLTTHFTGTDIENAKLITVYKQNNTFARCQKNPKQQ